MDMRQRATVDVEPAYWLKRGAGASFGFKLLHERKATFADTSPDVIADGLVDEVSVLSPGRKPAEPLAEVLMLKRSEPEPAGRAHPPAGVAFGHGEIITPPGTIIRRPGIGQILAVR